MTNIIVFKNTFLQHLFMPKIHKAMKTTNSLIVSQIDSEKYIIVSKTEPVFVVHCNYIGYLEYYTYKKWFIPEINLIGETFAINFRDAVNGLHEWIMENPHVLKYYPKAKFEIEVLDGTIKNGEDVRKKVYSITAAKAKKYLL